VNPHFEEFLTTADAPERMELFYRRMEEADPVVAQTLEGMNQRQMELLWRVVSSSTYLTTVLENHPQWLKSDGELHKNLFDEAQLADPATVTELRQELADLLLEEVANRDFEATGRLLRQFKTRQLFKIAARDLNKLGSTDLILQELSNLADICLQAVFRLVWLQLTEKIGAPYYKNERGRWVTANFSVIGLGKLGGQELNYSSDVDLIFVYSRDGFVFKEPPEHGETPRRALDNYQFFTRLAEGIVDEVSKSSSEGSLYRVDLRLRPEGQSGSLVRSLQSYENYYSQWGRTWERMMLIKARHVAGSSDLGAEFIEMIHPFCYPRYVSVQVPEEVAAIKERIEKEVIRSGELHRNVKLGWGGIREIEFVVQTIQVVDAGKMPYLQGGQTLRMLEKLAIYDRLAAEDSLILRQAYRFYRDVEHRLQMEENQQTHTLPVSALRRLRLARLMGFEGAEEFDAQCTHYQTEVRRIFEEVVHRNNDALDEDLTLPTDFEEKEEEWKSFLVRSGFKDPDTAYRLVKVFVQGPGYVHVSLRTLELGWKLLPRLFRLCPSEYRLRFSGEQQCFKANLRTLSDPDRVLARLDSFIQNYGGRQSLFETWFSSPFTFDLLLLLFDRSEYLAEVAIKTPGLVDEIMEGEQLRRVKEAREMLRDLEYGLEDEDQHGWIRRYHRVELMRIAMRDLVGMSDFAQNQAEINSLGEACVEYALRVVMKKFRLKKPPFAIIGMGKLGGRELTYGSDLDILFVCTPHWKGENKVQRMAFMLIDLLWAKTPLGSAYKTDSRLRPDGEKGALVSTLVRYERYYRHRAQLWEIQSLTRARVICGDVETGFQFMDMARSMTNFSIPRWNLEAYSEDWKEKILAMRLKVEKERTPYGKDPLAFKTGVGGLMDVEFLAQMLNMEFGWFQPNTRKALRLAASQDLLSEEDSSILIENFDKLMALEKVLRRWSYEGESVLPDTDAPLLRVAIRCGFDGIESFMGALAKWRSAIREVYLRLAGSAREKEKASILERIDA
jgi:glutamate-ammonia-ligase adenylyltransferase